MALRRAVITHIWRQIFSSCAICYVSELKYDSSISRQLGISRRRNCARQDAKDQRMHRVGTAFGSDRSALWDAGLEKGPHCATYYGLAKKLIPHLRKDNDDLIAKNGIRLNIGYLRLSVLTGTGERSGPMPRS